MFTDSERIIGLLRQIQARQAAGTHAAGLVGQAVAEVRAAEWGACLGEDWLLDWGGRVCKTHLEGWLAKL